jgi:Ca2+-binding RTX toxin-like protein
MIAGNAGRNVLLGGNGDDTLGGGDGRDVLIGGAGSDKFVFGRLEDSGVGAALRDVIGGFRSIEGDLIDLHQIDADIFSDGHQAFDYIGAAAFSSTAGELRFASGLMQVDVDGDGGADMEIAVAGVSTLAEDDFVLLS